MSWRYFGRTAGSSDVFEVYRFPGNGKPLHQQNDDDVYRISPGHGWERVGRSILMGDLVAGWFSERKDEISEADALALIQRWASEGSEEGDEE